MNKTSLTNIAVTALIVGCFTWILKPNRKPSNEAFELRMKVQELQYERKLDKIRFEKSLIKTKIINGNQETVDSVWNSYDFIFPNL